MTNLPAHNASSDHHAFGFGDRKLTYAFGMQAWKRPIMKRYFSDRTFVFIPLHLSERQLMNRWLRKIDLENAPEFFIWGLSVPAVLTRFLERHRLKAFFVEDGFLRSWRAHASRTPPLSLTLDGRTPYFDSRSPSDLETLLNTYDFTADPALMARASTGIARLLQSGLSKYNSRADHPADLYGPKRSRRILVIGQVENDASIRFGSASQITTEDILRLAIRENPDAEIIYKPHPDVLNNVRKSRLDLTGLGLPCRVLTENVSLAKALETIDHVYTITSLAGFEALMRGLPVTVLGLPFYAGWGLTDDRQPSPRRRRTLSIAELFAATYILYPAYFEPWSGRRIGIEQVVDLLQSGYKADFDFEAPKQTWKPWGAYGVLGWRHLLTDVVAPIISAIGTSEDARYYRAYPIDFFRERPARHYRLLGRILYPFDH